MKKTTLALLMAACFCLFVNSSLFSQTTAFTYQGNLSEKGLSATGDYDFQFKIFEDESGGKALVSAVFVNEVEVTDGYFSVALDFGEVFDGSARFLEIGVKPSFSGGEFTLLSPRQQITSAPYAIKALKAESVVNGSITSVMLGNAAVTSGKLADDAVTAGKLADDAVTLDKLSSEVIGMLGGGGSASVTPNQVMVDTGGAGDYTSIGAALADITPTANNPYTIKVLPGAYIERVVMKSNVHLLGSGSATTVIVFDSSTAIADEDFSVIHLPGLSNVAITGFTLTTAEGSFEQCVGIFDNASSPVISDIHVRSIVGNNMGNFAIEVFGVGSINSSPVIRDSVFEGIDASDAISLIKSEGLVSGNHFSDHYHALNLIESTARFINNQLADVGEGLLVDSKSDATVGFNNFIDTVSGSKGISNNGTARIIGNQFSGSFQYGIYTTGAATISGNTFNGSKVSAIVHYGDSGSLNQTSISDNLFIDCGGSGEPALHLIESSAVVSGNVFTGSPVGDIGVFEGNPTINNNITTGNVSGAATIGGFGNVTLATKSGEDLLITATEGVGIGTDDPQTMLDVAGVVTSSGSTGGSFTAFNPMDERASVHLSWLNNVARIRVGGAGGTNSGAQNGFDFQSVGDVSMMRIRGSGVGIGTSNPTEKLHVVGNILATGTITASSDFNLKKNFNPVDVDLVLQGVLDLPIQEWAYKVEDDSISHIGPMAQDFHSAFQLGANNVTIATVDADGVALAAVQGLNNKLEQALEKRDKDMEELKAQFKELQALYLKLLEEKI